MVAKLEVAQLYSTFRLEGMREAQSGMNALKGALGGITKGLLGLASVYGLKNVAKGFLDTAVQMENYQTSLRGVIKDVEETKRVFADINKWAALNPVDTDDAIRGFVLLKSAAVQNTKEAVEAAADLATVMQVQISDVASAIVSLNTIQLRRLGILLDQSGKKAIIQSGNVRKEVEKDVDSIRAGVVELIQENFGGMMQIAGDNWSATMKTMGGQWDYFKQSVMGSVGSGGPFDKLKGIAIEIRDSWSRWIESQDYQEFVRSIQGVLIPAIEGLRQAIGLAGSTIKLLYDNAQVLKLGLLGLAGYKGIGAATVAFISLRTQLVAGLALLPNATGLVSKLGKAFTMFSVTPGYINAIRNAIIALGLTPGGMVLTAVAGLLAIAVAMNDTFEKARIGLVNFNKELKNLDTEKLREMAALRDSSGGFGLGGSGWKAGVEVSKRDSQKALDEINKQSKAWRELSLARSDARDAAKLEWLKPKPKPEDPNKKKGKEEGPSAAERLVNSIRDQMKYLYADGKSFLPVLDEWARKLKPLSEGWKLIVDLQRDIRSDSAQRLGEETAARMERVAKREREIAEAREAAAAGVKKFYAELAWGNSQGFMSDENYFDIMLKSFNDLRSAYSKESGGFLDMSDWKNWTEEMRERFSTLKQLSSGIANEMMSNLSAAFERGKVGAGEFRQKIEELIAKYRELGLITPKEIEKIRNSMDDVINKTDDVREATKRWIADFQDGVANAIVSGGNLIEVLQEIGKQVANFWIKRLLFGKDGGGGWFGGLFKGLHSGGIVGKESSFVRRIQVPTLPKYHSGGIVGKDEQLSVLKKGEGVFTQEQMRAMGGDSYLMQITINAIDSKSFIQMVESNRIVFENIVIRSLAKSGPLRTAIRGAV